MLLMKSNKPRCQNAACAEGKSASNTAPSPSSSLPFCSRTGTRSSLRSHRQIACSCFRQNAGDRILLFTVYFRLLTNLISANELFSEGKCNCNIFADAPYFDTFTHRLKEADGLPWWSPSQVLTTN